MSAARLYCRIVGDGARPRYRDGEFLMLLPDRPPEVGRDVLLIMPDGSARVGELRAIDNGAVTFSPTWDSPEEVLARDGFARIVCVSGVIEAPDVAPGWEVHVGPACEIQ